MYKIKRKIIFNYLLSPISISLIRVSRSSLTYLDPWTSESLDSWKNVVYNSQKIVIISKKKCRSLGHGPIRNLLNAMDNLILLCILAKKLKNKKTKRDKKQKDFDETTIFSIFLIDFDFDKIFSFFLYIFFFIYEKSKFNLDSKLTTRCFIVR